MSRSEGDARAEDVELDARHLDLLRRYRDAMRHLLSLSRAEYAPRREDVASLLDEESEVSGDERTNTNQEETDDACIQRSKSFGPPLTISSVLYARLVVSLTRRAFSWAVPTREALLTVERHAGGYVLEMGAGTGFWTALLRARGNVRRIDAVDLAPCDGSEHNGHHAVQVMDRGTKKKTSANPPPFARVTRGTPEDVLGFGTEKPSALFLCWPPRERDDGEKVDDTDKTPEEADRMAIRALERFDGDAVLYVGEAPSYSPRIIDGEAIGSTRGFTFSRGATAGPAFHKELHKEWHLIESVPLPNWPGASDSLTVWRRRGAESGARAVQTDKKKEAPTEGNDFFAAATRAETATETETFATFATTRETLLLEAREAWESATVAGIAARASRGGARAMRGAEQSALRAVRERSGFLRRLALAFL